MMKTEIRAEEYRAKASEAARQAGESGLAQVREKFELAAATWRELADHEDERSARANACAAQLPPKAAKDPAAALQELSPCTA